MTADALWLVLLNACFLAAGTGVLAIADWPIGIRALGLAYLAGVAAYGVIAQLLFVLGASLDRFQLLTVCGLLALGTVMGRRSPQAVRWSPWPLPAAAMLALLAVDLWAQPLWSYDSWTFWTPKAHALAALGLDAGWFTQHDLISPDYPLVVPAVEAAGFRFTGYETVLLDLQSWLFLVAFVAAVAAIAGRRVRPFVAWVPLTMVVFAPAVADQLAAAEADIPLATLFATAGLLAYVWLRQASRPALALVGVLSAGAVATKVEGTIFVVALFVVLVPLVWLRSRPDAVLTLAAGAAAVAVGIAPWRIWLAVHDVAVQASAARITDFAFLVDHVGRAPHAAAYLAWKAVDPTRWILLVPLAVFAMVVAWRRGLRVEPIFAAATGLLALLGLVLAYWSTPLSVEFHLATSARRVVTGPVLLWAALTPMLLEARR